ncbi:MAG: glycosyltransferase [Planctomycetota bacterium]|jgi:glycosyltransferase involved in cell wall biosynthesis
MDICHVIATLDPAVGGPPVVALGLAAGQAQLGHATSILTAESPGRKAVIDQSIKETMGWDRVTYHRIAAAGRFERLLGGQLISVLGRLLPHLDVLHLHGLWVPMLLRAARQARRAGTPYSVTLHGVLDPWSLAQKRLKKRIALAVGYRRMLNAAAMLHALNEDEKNLIQPLRLRCPVEVIPNGVFLEEFDPLPEPGRFRAAHPELGERPYLIFMSRLHYKKGLDVLAEAFARYVGCGGSMDLVVAGPDDGARDDFERRVRDHGLQARVHVTGPIYGPQKMEALRDAAGFILPSRQEGFSMAITEAMAVGLPVIITENCHFPEVAEVGAGLVIPLDADEVTRSILRLAADPTAAAAMGKAARKLVESRYTWPAIARQTVDAYLRHLGQAADA